LEFVEHKHAVESIRRACDEGSKIVLIVGHPTDYSADAQIQQIDSTVQNQQISTNQINGHPTSSSDQQAELVE
jgi:hypothetical protein